ncbi:MULTISPECIES: hypothetical protein [unclassified Ruegeria]|uniref:hypothetical protein n=1 Tax=unclassified Ruegeria TaxID=2625375 RepID=UPI0014893E88|nr:MULTISPECIES: hypothetical protein [unclassified Ruegeria]
MQDRTQVSAFDVAPFSIAVGLISLLIVFGISWTTGSDFGYLTRDPAQQFKAPSYAGFLSNMGVLFWMASATVTAFGFALLSGSPHTMASRRFLLALTFLSTAFCLDDFFLLHERLPIGEKFFFGGYALFLAGTVVLYRRHLGRLASIHLVIAGLFFMTSIGIDFFQKSIQVYLGQYRILFEDGAKFLGAVFWLNFSWAVTTQQILSLWPNISELPEGRPNSDGVTAGE